MRKREALLGTLLGRTLPELPRKAAMTTQPPPPSSDGESEFVGVVPSPSTPLVEAEEVRAPHTALPVQAEARKALPVVRIFHTRAAYIFAALCYGVVPRTAMLCRRFHCSGGTRTAHPTIFPR